MELLLVALLAWVLGPPAEREGPPPPLLDPWAEPIEPPRSPSSQSSARTVEPGPTEDAPPSRPLFLVTARQGERVRWSFTSGDVAEATGAAGNDPATVVEDATEAARVWLGQALTELRVTPAGIAQAKRAVRVTMGAPGAPQFVGSIGVSNALMRGRLRAALGRVEGLQLLPME